ncbi:cobW-domain-containing protein [Pholiota conissans]|uniref:CobW-domain-containing protein n=1 Tax=Pholiota conissans TaxID=109636 RepID=A0A9P6D6U8_9AGAR|nr:cobW-domain-containing protein [Pholiota conissans]
MAPIPITVFTGFLGAGKTSTILSLLPRLPKDYKVVLLKNEFGDVQVDSQLAKQSSLAAVSEILNGCMCCVLVGQMQTALLEIRDNYRPDRIIIECSGSAFPATLAFQIRQLERDTGGDFELDAIVTVVDAENFAGYEDDSPTARMQASYSDLILINKWEHVSERQLDIVMDHLYTLNDETPKIKCQPPNGVDPALIFGLQSKLFLSDDESIDTTHHDEVETLTINAHGVIPQHQHLHGVHEHPVSNLNTHLHSESNIPAPPRALAKDKLAAALQLLPKDAIWRVKGFILLDDDEGWHILNWAFGRYALTPTSDSDGGSIRLTVMGRRGEVRRACAKFASVLSALD